MQKTAFIKSVILCAIVAFASPVCLRAQKYNFRTYTVADGLPNNQVNDVYQDKTGRLWVATMNGACRYDGQTFLKFDADNPVNNNPVKTIFEDKDKNIWLGTIRKGVCKFNGTQSVFYTANNGLLSDNVNAITQDNLNNYWFGTSEGLSRFDGKNFFSYTTSRGLISNTVNCLLFDKANRLWIGTPSGISVLSNLKFTNYSTANGLAGNSVYQIKQLDDGKIWIATDMGLSVFDGKSFANYTTTDGLPADRVTDVYQDYKKNKWFTTAGGGLCRLDETQFKTLSVVEGLPSNVTFSITEDMEGNLWLGTNKGLCRYSGDRFVTFTTDNGLTNNRILSVYNDNCNRTWFGLVNGGVNFLENGEIKSLLNTSVFNNYTIWSIAEDKQQNFWFGTTGGPAKLDAALDKLSFPFDLLNNKIVYTILVANDSSVWFGTDRGIYVYNNNRFSLINRLQGLQSDNIRALYQDDKGLIWVGTMQGIYFMNGNKAVCLNDFLRIPKAPVTSIIQDRQKNILFTTYDFGLYCFSYTNRSKPFSHLDITNGLISNRLLFAFADNDYLWLGTSQGVDRIDWNTYQKRNYVNTTHFDKSNGYFGVETNAACMDKNGSVWFATVNGAVRFNPKSGYSKTSVPVMVLNKLRSHLRDVNWAEKGFDVNPRTGLPINPQLPYGNNNLNFDFTGIYFAAPDEVQYRWKLVGFDDYWSPLNKLTEAIYSNIPPGDYIFTVQATANERDWSAPVEYAFSIKAPIWRTNFFYFLYILFSVGLVMFILKLRTRSLRNAQMILRHKVNERTRELRDKNLELAKLSIVASETGNAVLVFDANKELEWINEGFTRMTGYTKQDLLRMRGSNILNVTYNNQMQQILDDCIREKKSFVYETKMLRKNGEEFWTSSTLTPVFTEKGDLKNIVVIDTDITLRKIMEEQIRESLEEKGILLKEIHHRVKNNLQIIISLFNLQTSYVNDEVAAKALKEGQDRIRSMALIHERFYQSEGMSRIDFDDYIKRLCETISQNQGAAAKKIKLNIDAEKISLDIDTAVPCGLIINELVSNSIRHAFNGRDGEILVKFMQLPDKRYSLMVKDNGQGLPAGVDYKKSDSLGIQLVQALTDQIEGTLTVENGMGLAVKVEFKPHY